MNSSPWIILFAPFVSVFVIVLVTERFKKLSSYISVAAVAISFVFSLGVFFGQDGSASFNWIDLGVFQVKIGYLINDLTKLMLLVVSGVGLLIHIYSIGYMADDKGRSRYFCGLSLFTFSMLGSRVGEQLHHDVHLLGVGRSQFLSLDRSLVLSPCPSRCRQ